ncbi:MAG: hypothetical protein LC744_06455 [Chloroflexi bacterium]|nr:hypothetical protein [Chloroflexota bacterium]
MFSVAVKGYGIVVWDDGQWRTFSASESLSAVLAARVENVLKPIAYGYEEDIRDALLGMDGPPSWRTSATTARAAVMRATSR